MRRFANMVCTLLLVASYLWGGCVSCDQLLMQPEAAEDCCQHGKCNRAAHESMPEPEESSNTEPPCEPAAWLSDRVPEVHSDFAIRFAAVPANPATRYLLPSVEGFGGPAESFDLAANSPPDLPIQHASLLI